MSAEPSNEENLDQAGASKIESPGTSEETEPPTSPTKLKGDQTRKHFSVSKMCQID